MQRPEFTKSAKKSPAHAEPTKRIDDPTTEEIAARAYEIYLRHGQPEGQHLEHWYRAEEELRAERNPVAQA